MLQNAASRTRRHLVPLVLIALGLAPLRRSLCMHAPKPLLSDTYTALMSYRLRYLDVVNCRNYATLRRTRLQGRSNVTNLKAKRRPAKVERKAGSPAEQGRDQTYKTLKPYKLSQRLNKLCDEGHVDSAVHSLKAAPLDAQNTAVWGTLIWRCMQLQRYELAYRLFTDMKRRGFSPTTRTYQTMFKGLSSVGSWFNHTKQLSHAHSLYENFLRHIESLKRHEPTSEELTTRPLNDYIKILGDSGGHEQIFEVYYALDQTGPFAPDQYFYTAMFEALAGRHEPAAGSRSASNAKLLWQQMLKASQRSPKFTVDSPLLAAAIRALSKGDPTDQQLAFSIVRDYLHLTAPDEPHQPPSKLLSSHTLEAALSLCMSARDHARCIYYLQQARKQSTKRDTALVIDRHHMEHALRAYASLARPDSQAESRRALQTLYDMLQMERSGPDGPRIRPAASTFVLVLTACWRSADWKSAAITFELMTGYRSRDFADEAGDKWRDPRCQSRSPGRNLTPNAEAMSCLVRAALGSGNRANMRQCLRMVSLFGTDNLFGPLLSDDHTSPSKKAQKDHIFYVLKLAGALKQTVDQVLDHSPEDRSQAPLWRRLKKVAEQVLKNPKATATEIPELERPGDIHEEFIGFEAAARRSASRSSPQKTPQWSS